MPKDRTKGINAIFILEIIGRPAEHLIKTLNKIIENMDKEKGVKVVSKDIKEAVEMKDQKNFYMTFAEVGIEAEGIMEIAGLVFKYMPANVEIVEPEIIAVSNNKWGEILSELTRRLHAYDELARIVQMKNAEMQKKLNEFESKSQEKKN